MSTPLLAHDVIISDGLTLVDLTTIEKCRLALLTIARDINRIEEQLADGPSTGEWAERAESAVRFKKALRQSVNELAGDLRRAERLRAAATREHVLVEMFKENYLDQFAVVLTVAKLRHPDLWGDQP